MAAQISLGLLRARRAASNFQEVFGGTLLGGSAFSHGRICTMVLGGKGESETGEDE
jgi:hypothetical protein